MHFLPADTGSLSALRGAAAGCRACHLYQNATQTVFGEGPTPADIMMVGEQPGDVEDREGHPFVGPAGRLLDKALHEAGLDRSKVYLTNIVKHFKHTTTSDSKRRIHAKPNQTEISACLPWLETELGVVRPKLVIALGSTAAQALMGRDFRVTKSRGRIMPWRDTKLLATVHPSSVLRATDRDEAFQGLVADLKQAVSSPARKR